MQKNKHSNIPIFIPELACPHQCVFCDQQKISGSLTIPTPSEINQIIDKYLSTMHDSKIVDIAFFGGNFTGIPIELQGEYLKQAFRYKKDGRVSGIRLSTRPDYIDSLRLDLLKRYGVTTIELGAQSTNDRVLNKSGRGHTFRDIQNASKLINDYGFELGLQMMIGLPGDNADLSIKTAEDIILLEAKNTRIYPTLVVKGTYLEKLYMENSYTPLTIGESVATTKEIIKLFENAGVKILRVGLHPSSDLESHKSLVAGPYHHSFKELVLTELWDEILFSNPSIADRTSDRIKIRVNGNQLNYCIGYQKKNKNKLISMGFKPEYEIDNSYGNYQVNVSNY